MGANPPTVNPWMMLPFGVLLVLIALGPLVFPKWWPRNYAKVTFALAVVTLAYYLIGLNAVQRIGYIAHEYISFIALIGSLYVVSGGIHINVKGEATPRVNVAFLFIGALLSNILGTTGASMLLIRPWLRMNKYRATAHHVVFFIFIISNIGGCLTPIGDPPLLLGYLAGVPFWWVVEHCWPMWSVGMFLLLLMFYALDRRNYSRAPENVRAELTEHEQWRFEGLGNIGFLGVILAAVFVNNPPFLREILMLVAAAASYFTTHKEVHEANHFDFHPVKEVAVLFVGIFATMLPALDWLGVNAEAFNRVGVSGIYWGCGSLSSALDNAPTYLCFLKAISVPFSNPEFVAGVNQLIQSAGATPAQAHGAYAEQIHNTFLILQRYYPAELASGNIGTDQIAIAGLLGDADGNRKLVAIAIGSVFFGANTYMGNGPNLMVKSIADRQKIRTPGFLNYLWRFTIPFMLPTLFIVWILFFRS